MKGNSQTVKKGLMGVDYRDGTQNGFNKFRFEGTYVPWGVIGPLPLKNTILGSYRTVRLPSRRISEKSAPPWYSGEEFPTSFSKNRRQGGLTAR